MKSKDRGRFRWGQPTIVAAFGIALLVAADLIAGSWFAPYAQRKLVEAVGQRLESGLAIHRIEVRVLWRVHVNAEDMEVYHHGGRDIPPLIKVRHLSCDASIIGLLTGPRLENIRLNGLEIRVSREDNNGGEGKRGPEEVMDRSEVRSIDVQEIVADGTMLQIAKAAGKQLLTFDIQKLTVYRVAADRPMRYRAELRNPEPRGLINVTGDFGPWRADDPGQTEVTGDYTFNADPAVFKAAGGNLSSTGQFHGTLDHLEAHGTRDSPNFALTAAAQEPGGRE